MYRFLPLLPALVFATSAFAQAMPEGTHQDLWCGTAFNIFLEVPSDATEEQKSAIALYLEGADKLIARAEAAMLAAGFAQDAVDKAKTDLLEPVGRQVSGAEEAEFTPDECSLLIEEFLPPAPADSSAPAESSAPAAQ
ncbi:MAG TPA: hypothetical protein VG757_06995 [Devosia sp.]|nr:hypothetical protein [Devosia sp.]